MSDHQAIIRSHSHVFYRQGINLGSFYYHSMCIFHIHASNRISTTHCSFSHLSIGVYQSHGYGFYSIDHNTVSCLSTCRFLIHLYYRPHTPQSTLTHQTIFHVLCRVAYPSSIYLDTRSHWNVLGRRIRTLNSLPSYLHKHHRLEIRIYHLLRLRWNSTHRCIELHPAIP